MDKRLLVDKKICTGCRLCEITCSMFHEKGRINTRKARIQVMSDILEGIDNPIVCKQCTRAPCMEACPVQAIELDQRLKIPRVIPERCIGCMACVEACPFSAMFFDRETGVAIKCDLCGGDPQCVKFCRAYPHIGRSSLSYCTVEEWIAQRCQ